MLIKKANHNFTLVFLARSVILLLLCQCGHAFSNNKPSKSLVEQYMNQYEALERFNDQNELSGHEHLNDYLIVLDGERQCSGEIDTESWIEERTDEGGPPYLLHSNYELLRKQLREFNLRRADKLRLYVVAISGITLYLKDGLKIADDEVLREEKRITMHQIAERINQDFSLEEYLRYKNLRSEVPKQIAAALAAKGYDERAVYTLIHYSLSEYSSNSNGLLESKEYLYDNLLMKGGRLKTDQLAIKRRVRSGSDSEWLKLTFAERINSAVHNICMAIERVVDQGLKDTDDRDARCRMQGLEEVAVSTKTFRELMYDSEVGNTGALVTTTQSSHTRLSRYAVADDWSRIDAMGIFAKEKLPDKLKVFNEGSVGVHSNFSDYKLYVVYKKVDFALSESTWFEFAKAVHTAASLPDNAILVTVPYYTMDCNYVTGQGGIVTDRDMLLMPGAWCPANEGLTRIMNSAFSELSIDTDTRKVYTRWESVFDNAFRKIPKDYLSYDYALSWNGDFQANGKINLKRRLTGVSDLIAVSLFVDSRFLKFVEIEKDFPAQYRIPVDEFLNKCPQNEDYDDCLVDYWLATSKYKRAIDELSEEKDYKIIRGLPDQKSVTSVVAGAVFYGVVAIKATILGQDNPLDKKEESIVNLRSNLKQSNLSQRLASQYITWYIARYWPKIRSGSVDGSKFYGGVNTVDIQDNLAKLDDLSLMASLVQLDAVFDAAGAYYAYSNGLYAEAAIYTASLGLPVSAGTLKLLREGKAIIVRLKSGKYAILSKEVAQHVSRVAAADAMSDVAKAVLQNTDALQAAYKHADDAGFIQALETGLLSGSESTVRALNDTPGLIDDYYLFHKEGRGNLNAFLELRATGALLDGESAKAFRALPGINVASLGSDAHILASVARIKPKDGWFDVIVHSDGVRFWVLRNDGQWAGLTHRDLYNYLKRNEAFKNATGVRLIACQAGTKQLAENFSNKAHKKAMAYSGDEIGVALNGDLVSINGKGHWVEYENGNWTHSFDDAASVPPANRLRQASPSDEATSLGWWEDAVIVETSQYTILKQTEPYKGWFEQFNNGERARVYENLMSLEEEVALRAYVAEGSALNLKLSTGQSLTDYDKEWKSAIDNALDKLQNHTSGPTYRGIKPGGNELAYILSKGDGAEITFKDFKSTSKSEALALTFNPGTGQTKYLGVFHTSKGVDVSATQADLQEVLIRYNSRFKIKIDDEKNGIIRIHFNEIGRAVENNFDELISQFKSTNPHPTIAKMVDNAKSANNKDLLEDLFNLRPRQPDAAIVSSGNTYNANRDNLLKVTDGIRQTIQVPVADRQQYEVVVKNGRLYQNGARLDDGEGYIFVMAGDGKIYARSLHDIPAQFAHSSFLGDNKVVTAGAFKLDAGRIELTNASGHYKPTEASLEHVIREFTSRGVTLKSIDIGEIKTLNPVKLTENGVIRIRVFTSDFSTDLGSGFLNDEGYLELSIKVKFQGGQDRLAKGEDVFEEIYRGLEAQHGSGQIRGMWGIWVDDIDYRDNLDDFNKVILTKVKTGEMTEKEAVFKTFTGEMARRKGFTYVDKIIGGYKNPDGTYRQSVQVPFSRPAGNTAPANDIAEALSIIRNSNDPKLQSIQQQMAVGEIEPMYKNILTLEEESIFQYFVRENNHDLNEALIKKVTSPVIEAHKKVIKNAINRLPKHNERIYRGAGYDESIEYGLLTERSTFEFRQFAYASKDENIALGYCYFGGDKGFVLYHIRPRTAVDITSHGPDSQLWGELVFPANAKFIVTNRKDVQIRGKSVTIYEADEL